MATPACTTNARQASATATVITIRKMSSGMRYALLCSGCKYQAGDTAWHGQRERRWELLSDALRLGIHGIAIGLPAGLHRVSQRVFLAVQGILAFVHPFRSRLADFSAALLQIVAAF